MIDHIHRGVNTVLPCFQVPLKILHIGKIMIDHIQYYYIDVGVPYFQTTPYPACSPAPIIAPICAPLGSPSKLGNGSPTD